MVTESPTSATTTEPTRRPKTTHSGTADLPPGIGHDKGVADFIEGLGRTVAYYPALRPVTGSTVATLFLCQLIYWNRGNKQKSPEGWIYKTQAAFEVETGLTRSEQDTARKHLVERGLIEVELRGVPAIRHIRVNRRRLNAEWERLQSSLLESSNLDSGNPTNWIEGIEQSIPETTRTSYSETTAKSVTVPKEPSPVLQEEGVSPSPLITAPVSNTPETERSHLDDAAIADATALACLPEDPEPTPRQRSRVRKQASGYVAQWREIFHGLPPDVILANFEELRSRKLAHRHWGPILMYPKQLLDHLDELLPESEWVDAEGYTARQRTIYGDDLRWKSQDPSTPEGPDQIRAGSHAPSLLDDPVIASLASICRLDMTEAHFRVGVIRDAGAIREKNSDWSDAQIVSLLTVIGQHGFAHPHAPRPLDTSTVAECWGLWVRQYPVPTNDHEEEPS